MAQTFINLRDNSSSILQDTGNSIFDTTELGLVMKDVFRLIARFSPRIVRETFQVESRTGSATEDKASALVDDTNAQFLSTDVGKVAYNSSDKTWAVVTAFVDTGELTLSKDIFTDGDESYELFNKGCSAITQINIEDIKYLWVEKVEYPIGTERNFEIDGDILTIDIETVDDTEETDADKDVYVFFGEKHRVSQLTTLTGQVNLGAGYDAGDVSMVLDTLQATGTIEEGQEFTIAGTRGTYTVTADATITTNAATISFYPGLESDVDDDAVLTFKLSTLPVWLEPLYCEYVAAKAAMSKSSQPIQEIINAIAVLATASTAIGLVTARVAQAVTDIDSGRDAAALSPAIILEANTAIDKIDDEITQALADLDTGRAIINTIPKGGAQVPGNYANYAAGDIRNGIGYLQEAIGLLRQAGTDESVAGTYGNIVVKELNAASMDINKGIAYLRKINTAISLGGAWRHYQEWGERKLAYVERELRNMASPRPAKIHPRT